MLDKPDIQEALILAALRDAYGLDALSATFLPLGADFSTAVFKVVAVDGAGFFLKLRRGTFDELAVAIPHLLREHGIAAVMAPIPTPDGRLCSPLGEFTCILYPFVDGHNGWDAAPSARQWRDLGAALRAVHATRLPPDLEACLPREAYSPRWRESLTRFLRHSEVSAAHDPEAARLAAVLQARRAQIEQIIERAAQLAEALRQQSRPLVLCHTDIHGWNVLLSADDALFIVDWDSPLLAPKERDLMFTRGRVGGIWYHSIDEAMFCEGYGPAEIDVEALAYYRLERIVEDIAVDCEMVFSTAESNQAQGNNRAQAVEFVVRSFLPHNVVDIAFGTDF